MSLDEFHAQLSTVRQPPLTPFLAGKKRENAAPKSSSFTLHKNQGEKPTLMASHLRAVSLSPSSVKPFAHKATWKLMFLLISLF